jgi:hypothetical protein
MENCSLRIVILIVVCSIIFTHTYNRSFAVEMMGYKAEQFVDKVDDNLICPIW